MILEVNNLRKTFVAGKREIKALDGVSLQVKQGEVVVINGKSGCGKTTLLLTGGGLLAPDAGSVVLDGVDLYAVSSERRTCERADNIGFVFQQFHLIPYLDVMENVLVPTIGRKNSAAKPEDLLRRFDLGDRAHHKPAQLSTGERQRVALVRALVNQPKFLFADEPTGNLDDQNAAEVMRYISRFADEGGAVLLVSHDQRTAVHASRKFQMNKGCLREE